VATRRPGGYFVEPTLVLGSDPEHDVFRTEYFGPLLAVHVYDDRDSAAFDRVLGTWTGARRTG